MSYIYVNTYQRKNYHTSFKCSDIHCCIGKVFTCYMFKVTHTPTNEHGTSHYMRQIFLRGTYCVQYHLINKAASQHFNQDNVYSNPFKNANVNTCARTPLLPLQKKTKNKHMVTWPAAQWQRLRSPGCWRWKTLCWTPWRTRFWRWMAFRVLWCRSIQLRPFGTKLMGLAWAKALSRGMEVEAARSEELLIWFWGSGLNTLKTHRGMRVCEAYF